MHGRYGMRSGTKIPLYWTMQKLFALATGLLQLAIRVDERDAKSNILLIVQSKLHAKSRADSNLDHTGSTVRLGSESQVAGVKGQSLRTAWTNLGTSCVAMFWRYPQR